LLRAANASRVGCASLLASSLNIILARGAYRLFRANMNRFARVLSLLHASHARCMAVLHCTACLKLPFDGGIGSAPRSAAQAAETKRLSINYDNSDR